MSWDNHDHNRSAFTSRAKSRVDDSARQLVNQLAQQYTAASGRAYARGDDEIADRYREAAKLLRETANRLPPLAVVTR